MLKASARAVKSTRVLPWCKHKPIRNFAVGFKAPVGRLSLNLISDGADGHRDLRCSQNLENVPKPYSNASIGLVISTKADYLNRVDEGAWFYAAKN